MFMLIISDQLAVYLTHKFAPLCSFCPHYTVLIDMCTCRIIAIIHTFCFDNQHINRTYTDTPIPVPMIPHRHMYECVENRRVCESAGQQQSNARRVEHRPSVFVTPRWAHIIYSRRVDPGLFRALCSPNVPSHSPPIRRPPTLPKTRPALCHWHPPPINPTHGPRLAHHTAYSIL